MEEIFEMRQRLLAADPFSPQIEDRFTFGGKPFSPSEIVASLERFLTEERMQRIDEVLDHRTRTVATVVEGLVNMGNVSAVMRTADALGYQSFHVITGGESFKNSRRTSQGAEKWLDVYQWASPAQCVAHLKEVGYQIIVTHLDEHAVPIDQLDFTQPTALVFGNEQDGVTEEMLELADVRAVIPIVGFVQSFNISVAAAVTLYHAFGDRMQRQGFHGDLTEGERAELRAIYYLRSVRRAGGILADSVRRRSK